MAKFKTFTNKIVGEEDEIINPVEIVKGLFDDIHCGECGEKLICIKDVKKKKFYVHKGDLEEI